LLLVAAVTGCARYSPSPLEPRRLQAEFMQRQLEQRAQPWTLDDLTAAAARLQLDLAVARAHAGAVQAGEQTAGEMPNPSLSFAPQIASNAGAVNPWTVGFTFDIPIETAGKREDRIEQAKWLTEAAQLDLAQAVWKVRSTVRAALLEYLLNERAAEAWEREVKSRDSYVGMLEARLKAGEAGRAEVNTARVDLIVSRQALRAAKGQVAESRARLAAAIGVPAKALENARFAWPELDQPPAVEDLAVEHLHSAGLLNRLDIRRSLAEYAAAEAALRLEIAKQYPDLHLGPGYQFDQGQNKWELGLSVTLPILNQNGGAIAEARGRRDELAAKFSQLQAQVIAETETAAARLKAASNELTEADAQVATLDQELAAVRRGLQLGEQDRLAVTSAEIQRDVATRLRIEAIRKAQAARGALEDAIQRPLPTNSQEDTTRPHEGGQS
jgi:outer membrane protein TolC